MSRKYRGDRWEDRDILKKDANRRGNLEAMHPQVRRHLQDDTEVKEALLNGTTLRSAESTDAKPKPNNKEKQL